MVELFEVEVDDLGQSGEPNYCDNSFFTTERRNFYLRKIV